MECAHADTLLLPGGEKVGMRGFGIDEETPHTNRAEAATQFDRRREPALVLPAWTPLRRGKVPQAIPDRRLRRRLCLSRGSGRNRARLRTTYSRSGRAANRDHRSIRLPNPAVLE